MLDEEKTVIEFRPATKRWLFGTFAGWITLMLCFVGVGFVILFVTWLNNYFTRFVVTDQRIIIHEGIIFKKIDEVELYRVKDVRVDFSLLNQIVNIGTITVRASDGSTARAPLAMVHVFDARQHRETMRRLVEAMRLKRGVRELDMGVQPA